MSLGIVRTKKQYFLLKLDPTYGTVMITAMRSIPRTMPTVVRREVA